MPDVQIHPTGVVSTPGDYTIPDTAELLLKNAFARFDGSGAAGSYQPLLRIISDAGSVVVEAVSDTTIAAGASCDASWFPHIAGAAASTPSASVGLPVCSLATRSAGTAFNADGVQHFISIHDVGVFDRFATSDSSVFTNGSSTLFTGSAVYGVQINAAGTYAVFNNAFTQSGGVAGHQVATYWAASNGSSPSLFQQGRSSALLSDTWDLGQSGIGPHNFLHEWMTVTAGQTPAVLVVTGQSSGGGTVTVGFSMMVVQLTSNVLAKV